MPLLIASRSDLPDGEVNRSSRSSERSVSIFIRPSIATSSSATTACSTSHKAPGSLLASVACRDYKFGLAASLALSRDSGALEEGSNRLCLDAIV